MPDISYAVSLKVDKEFLSNSVSVGNATANMNQVGMQSFTLTLSTNAVQITTANLSSVGLAFMRNLSTATAATVTVGIDAGGSFLGFNTLRAGEPAIYRLSAGQNYFATGTAGSRLRVDITEG
jgi:hypothetical protein